MNKILSFIKKNYLWIIVIVCLILTLAILEDVYEQEMMRGDKLSYNFFVATIRNNNLTNIMKIITNFGSALVLSLICIIAFIFIKNKKKALCILSNLIIITIFNQSVKFIVQRPRPNGYRLINESGYSFPSGHSMVSVAFYGFLIYLIYKSVKNKTIKYLMCAILGLLILAIGSSRIYLGVHYASDVLAGALLSISYLIIYVKAMNRFVLKNI